MTLLSADWAAASKSVLSSDLHNLLYLRQNDGVNSTMMV